MVGEGHLFGLSTLFGLRLSSASASASISGKNKLGHITGHKMTSFEQ